MILIERHRRLVNAINEDYKVVNFELCGLGSKCIVTSNYLTNKFWMRKFTNFHTIFVNWYSADGQEFILTDKKRYYF